jgi:hypothetical protein
MAADQPPRRSSVYESGYNVVVAVTVLPQGVADVPPARHIGEPRPAMTAACSAGVGLTDHPLGPCSNVIVPAQRQPPRREPVPDRAFAGRPAASALGSSFPPAQVLLRVYTSRAPHSPLLRARAMFLPWGSDGAMPFLRIRRDTSPALRRGCLRSWEGLAHYRDGRHDAGVEARHTEVSGAPSRGSASSCTHRHPLLRRPRSRPPRP